MTNNGTEKEESKAGVAEVETSAGAGDRFSALRAKPIATGRRSTVEEELVPEVSPHLTCTLASRCINIGDV